MWLPLSIALVAWVAPPTERLLLVEDNDVPNFERTLVHQQLLTNLMRDPAAHVVSHGASPTHLLRSVELADQADMLAGEARRHLHALNPQSAAHCASAAALRYSRLATLTGDVVGLADALALNAASHLLQGHNKEGEESLKRLLLLDPAFVPSSTWFNHAMQKTVRRTRRTLQRAPHQDVRLVLERALDHPVTPGGPANEVAVFVDGHFIGFGDQTLSLAQGMDHLLWLVPSQGAPQGANLTPSGALGRFLPEVRVPLWPEIRTQRGGQSHFGHVVAASRLQAGEVDPYHPSLASRRIDTVLVLAYTQGALRLTTFELRRGQRRTRQAAAVVTNLWDVNRIAGSLLEAAPPLAPVPNDG